MCGITGMIYPEKTKRVDGSLLRRMNDSLTHRGPDDEGFYVDGRVGLAMRRLSIIDLEGGHQPLSNENGEIWTVFNGEIYNFPELRRELIEKGHQFKTRTDTEVIVHLYEELGESFVQQLRGMFAIALWDKPAEKLLLYRDRVGIKPLHYWIKNGALVFGSEIKAVLQCPEVGTELSESALGDYLSFFYVPAPKTIYREISKLPPGHFLRYQNGKTDIESYWDFSAQIDDRVTEKEWAERLRAALQESVRMHLISDVPLGAFLSGGLDSSTVVAWMSRENAGAVKTYSIGFGDAKYNELPYAREVARFFKTDHHDETVEADAFRLLPKIIAGFDEPFGDQSAIPTYLVSQFARRGVKVALSGDGGDELFGGYLWTQKELWLEKYRRFPAWLKRSCEKMLLGPDYQPLRGTGVWSTLQKFFYDGSRLPWESFGRRVMGFQPGMKKGLLQPWIQDQLARDESSEIVREFFERDRSRSVMDRCLYFDSKVYLPDDILTKVDRMSMLHSLEVRVPLLDHRVVELACSIPVSLKMRGRTTKYILKQAMKSILPPGILKQRKQGFAVPIHRWFRQDLYELTRKLLLEHGALSSRYFRPEYLTWLLAEHRAGRQHFGNQLYALVFFELWLRLKERGPENLGIA